MSGVFTTREIAVAIWVLAFIAWAFARREIRRPLAGVLHVALAPKLVVAYAILAIYTGGFITLLYRLGLWDLGLLKDSILWFLLCGLPFVFSGVADSLSKGHWKRQLLQQLTLIVVLEYVVNVHTFSLWVELLLIPLIALVVMVAVVANSDRAYSGAARITSWLLFILGLGVMITAIWQMLAFWTDLWSLASLREVVLSPILTVAALPLGYLMSLVSAYEQLFLRLEIGQTRDGRFVRRAKVHLVRHFGGHPVKIHQFTRRHSVDLMRVRTSGELDRVLRGEALE